MYMQVEDSDQRLSEWQQRTVEMIKLEKETLESIASNNWYSETGLDDRTWEKDQSLKALTVDITSKFLKTKL